MFDFANAKPSPANAYDFKLRCTFVHALLTLRLLVFACQQTKIGAKSLECSLKLARRFFDILPIAKARGFTALGGKSGMDNTR
ncbi:hypothetical protein [Helicobacter pylori]|uniref:hypothetical protein n=1 Tax=Helicobacter pylori TaxID=210 RepID=UPI0039E0C34A